MRIGLLIVMAWVCAASASHAQANQPTPDTALVDRFFADLAKTDIETAFAALLKNSPILAQGPQLQLLKNQVQTAMTLYGKPLGADLYKREQFGPSLVKVLYVQRLEKHPLIWKFWVYQASGWQVNALVFNDQFNFE